MVDCKQNRYTQEPRSNFAKLDRSNPILQHGRPSTELAQQPAQSVTTHQRSAHTLHTPRPVWRRPPLPPHHHRPRVRKVHRHALLHRTRIRADLGHKDARVVHHAREPAAAARDGHGRAVHIHLAVANLVEPGPGEERGARGCRGRDGKVEGRVFGGTGAWGDVLVQQRGEREGEGDRGGTDPGFDYAEGLPLVV